MKMNLNDFLTFNYCKVHIKYTPKVPMSTQNLFTIRTSKKKSQNTVFTYFYIIEIHKI